MDGVESQVERIRERAWLHFELAALHSDAEESARHAEASTLLFSRAVELEREAFASDVDTAVIL